jgi:hypothetical protein
MECLSQVHVSPLDYHLHATRGIRKEGGEYILASCKTVACWRSNADLYVAFISANNQTQGGVL